MSMQEPSVGDPTPPPPPPLTLRLMESGEERPFLVHPLVVQIRTSDQIAKVTSGTWRIMVEDAAGRAYMLTGVGRLIAMNPARQLVLAYGQIVFGGGSWDQCLLAEPKGGGTVLTPYFVKMGEGRLSARLYIAVTEESQALHDGPVLSSPRKHPKQVEQGIEQGVVASSSRDEACEVMQDAAGLAKEPCNERLRFEGVFNPVGSFWQTRDLAPADRRSGVACWSFRFSEGEMELVPGETDIYQLKTGVFPEDLLAADEAMYRAMRFRVYRLIAREGEGGQTLVAAMKLHARLDAEEV